MVAHVLRLRLDLLIGSLRGGAAQAVRTLIGAALLVLATVVVCWALLTQRHESARVAETVSVLVGCALMIGALFGPVAANITDQLDPRRFAVFGMSASTLAPTLALASLVSLPTLAVLAVSVSFAVVWTDRGVPAGTSWLFAMVGFVTVILLSRISMALSTFLFRGHRSRETAALFGLGIVVIVAPATVFLGSLQWRGIVPSALQRVVDILSITPFGAAWAAPAITESNENPAGAMVVALLSVVAVGVLWYFVVQLLLTTTERPDRERSGAGMGWFAVLPGTAGGAVAARSLVYWTRDRRYIMNVAVVPVASVIAALPLLVAGVPAELVALVPVPIMALFLGWIPHNDIAYDSTAIWLHIVSGVRGISDRVGRLAPIFLLTVPLLAIAVPLSVALYGRWVMLPALSGVAISLFLTGLGLSSITSVLAPYPVARPGDSPFQQPQRANSGVGAQALALLGAIVLSLPAILFAWQTAAGETDLAMPALWSGIIVGGVVAVAGVSIGAVLFERRGSRVMEFAEAI